VFLLPRIRLRTGAAVLLFLSFLVQAPPASASDAPDTDETLREGYSLLTNEEYDEARRVFSRISPDGYDLGDYLLYFTGFSLARQGKQEEAASVLGTLAGSFPESPLSPYLSHELAYAAAKADDLAVARKHFSASRGKVSGNGRKSEEGYIAARLLEREIPAGEGTATPPPPVKENGNGIEPEALPLPEEPEKPLILFVGASKGPQFQEDDRPTRQGEEQQEDEDGLGDDPGLEDQIDGIHLARPMGVL